MSHPALVAEDLVKTYPGRRGAPPVRALDGLTLTVEEGSLFALLGPNGAGKSTTVKILTTLSRPDSGTATVAGLDVLRAPDAVRRVIGVVTQRPSADPMATGRENLLLAARIQGSSAAAAAARSDHLLERLLPGDHLPDVGPVSDGRDTSVHVEPDQGVVRQTDVLGDLHTDARQSVRRRGLVDLADGDRRGHLQLG